MRARDVGLATAVLALAAAAAWWFGLRSEVASEDASPVEGREAPGAIDPAPPEAALAGQGRTKPAAGATATRRALGAPKPVEGAAIRGVVVDAAGAGIAGARVVAIPDTVGRYVAIEAVGAEGGTGAENFTDAQGRFVVAAVGDAPMYGLVAQADGFAMHRLGDVRVGADVRIVLGEGSRLTGRVLTLEGEPIAGATVRVATTLDLVRFEATATSGADGRYVVEGLPPADDFSLAGAFTYSALFVQKDGYAPLMVPGLGRPVPGRRGVLEQDLVLIRGATLVGRVLDDATGDPVEGARVVVWTIESLMGSSRPSGASLTNPWTNRIVGETTSAADGAFRVEHLPATGFHPVVTHNMGQRGMTLGYVSAGKPGTAWGSEEVPVVADGATIEATIRVSPAASVVGRVVDAAGAPVAEASLWSVRDGHEREQRMPPPDAQDAGLRPKTAADGTYRLAGVPASRSGPTRTKIIAYLKGTAPGKPPTVEVDVLAGQETRAPDLVIDAAAAAPAVAATVVVRVTDVEGRPIGGATYQVTGNTTYFPVRQALRTDREGRVRIPLSPPRPGAPASTYVIRASGFAPATVDLGADAAPDREVAVTLAPARRLTGRVLRADRAPAPGAVVSVYNAAVPIEDLLPKAGTPSWAPRKPRPTDPPLVAFGVVVAADDGTFVADDLPEGPYHLVAHPAFVGTLRSKPAPPATLASVATGATDLELVLPANPAPEGGRILGTVVDTATGRPVGTITVTATRVRAPDEPAPGPVGFQSDDGSQMYFAGPTGPQVTQTSPGRFEATGTEPGTYDLVVTAPGYVRRTVPAVTVATADVEVPPISLSRGTRVHGRVRLPDGEAHRDRTLILMPDDGDPARGAATTTLSGTGRYDVSGLVPGRYRVLAAGSGFTHPPIASLLRAGDAPVTLPDGADDVEVDLDLVFAATLRLDVRDPRVPAPAWMGRRATDAQTAFGKATSLVVLRADGTEVRRVPSLEKGLASELTFLTVLPGTYVFRLSMPGGEVDERTVEAAPGAETQVALGQAPSPPPGRPR